MNYLPPTYKIVRFCFDEKDPDHRRVIATGLSLEEAQAYCQREDTHGDNWFDGYQKENPTEEDIARQAEADANLAKAVRTLQDLGL